MKKLLGATAGVILASFALVATAQAYPSRTIFHAFSVPGIGSLYGLLTSRFARGYCLRS